MRRRDFITAMSAAAGPLSAPVAVRAQQTTTRTIGWLSLRSADRIDHRGLLANKQMPCAVKHQAALLLRRLGGHKPHVGSGDSLTDGLCVSHVILQTLDVGFT